nr:MFS transporter [Candidatus Sigynarchaeota archaeon]
MAPILYAQRAQKEPGARKGGRVLSLYRVSFTQICFGNLFGLALYNLFIFQFQLPVATIGLISAINSFAYILSPVLFRKHLRKLGTHVGLKITSILVALNFTFIVVVPSTPSLLLVYILDGMISSIFWSLISAIAGAWHEVVPEHLQASVVKGYGMSWNLGALAGELTGFLLSVSGITDGTIAIIGLLGIWMQIWFVFRLHVPSPHPREGKEHEITSPSREAGGTEHG